MAKTKFKLKVNGKNRKVTAEPDEPLLWIIRDKLDLTGTKFGCGKGICGACTVLMDGQPVRSCVVTVSTAAKAKSITTIEGLEKNGKLNRLQRAFLKYTAYQCGFCTPGMILTATAFLEKNPNPTRKEIIKAMNNNLCRCGSHVNIIEAIESVAAKTVSRG